MTSTTLPRHRQVDRWVSRLDTLPRWVLPGAAVLFLVVFLLPVIHAPFFSDDITYSEVVGYRAISGKSLFGMYFDGLQRSITKSGRPQILGGFPGYFLFNLFQDHRVAYHALLLALTALDAALVFALLRRLRAPAAAAALAVVLAAAWMQLRIYHDSLISFAGLMQVITACVVASLWFFARWLDDGRPRDMVGAVAFFFIACATYEISPALCLAHIALAISQRRGWAAVRAMAPVVGVAVLFALTSVVLRHVESSTLDAGYGVNAGGPWTVLRTYAVQLISPLPDMSIVADPSIAGAPTPGERFAATWRGLATAAAVAGLSLALIRAGTTRWAPIVAVGLGLYLAPPALLAVAPKYQTELDTARAYLPVLMQVFGLAVLATAALAASLRIAAGRSKAMLAAVIAGAALFAGVTGGVTGFNNVRVVGFMQPDRASRDLIEAAAERGAFDRVPARASVLFSDRDLAWQGPTPLFGYPFVPLMLADKTGRAFDARLLPVTPPAACPRLRAVVQPTCAPAGRSAVWSRVRLRRDGGTVVVAGLSDRRPAAVASTPAAGLLVYREVEGDGTPDPPRLVGATSRGKPWDSAGVRWRKFRDGDGWALYAGSLGPGPRPVASTLDDDQSFVDFTALPAPAQRVRLLGTRELLP